MNFLPRKKNNIHHKGFTLIELVVIISIFAIMAAVALFNFQGFQSDVAINNLAHDMALTIRQAQVFGWSGQTQEDASLIPQLDSNGNPIRYADGVYFQYTAGAFANQFILYTKTNPTDPQLFETTDTINDTVKIQGDVHIVGIKTGAQSDLALTANHEMPPTGNLATGDVSIAFSRPLPEAIFFVDGQQDVLPTDQYMAIYIAGDNETDSLYVDHTVFISRFGEIEVQ